MDRIRQFVNYESGHLVACEWDAAHGAWCCESDRDGRFHCCSGTIADLFSDLLDAGYEEA